MKKINKQTLAYVSFCTLLLSSCAQTQIDSDAGDAYATAPGSTATGGNSAPTAPTTVSPHTEINPNINIPKELP